VAAVAAVGVAVHAKTPTSIPLHLSPEPHLIKQLPHDFHSHDEEEFRSEEKRMSIRETKPVIL